MNDTTQPLPTQPLPTQPRTTQPLPTQPPTALLTAADWPLVLLAVLAIIYLVLGFSAGAIGLLGILGAIAVVVALLIASRSRTAASAVLVLGAIPFALATWSSLVIPLTAVLLLSIGLPQIKRLAGQSNLAPNTAPTTRRPTRIDLAAARPSR